MPTLLLSLALQADPRTYDRAAMLALDEHAFDQETTGEWRPLADAGSFFAAADLIRDWRATNATAAASPWLYSWHDGQMRALAG